MYEDLDVALWAFRAVVSEVIVLLLHYIRGDVESLITVQALHGHSERVDVHDLE